MLPLRGVACLGVYFFFSAKDIKLESQQTDLLVIA
jgi:hypothetical protein